MTIIGYTKIGHELKNQVTYSDEDPKKPLVNVQLHDEKIIELDRDIKKYNYLSCCVMSMIILVLIVLAIYLYALL
jgi:hypothetical protein